jgi:HK97 family phage major capsid protein
MDAQGLRDLHEEYRRAIEAARDAAGSPEQCQAAKVRAGELRIELDNALIVNEETREMEQRAAAVEARAHMMEKVATVAERKSDICWSEVRSGVMEAKKKGDGYHRSFEVMLPHKLETRTEYDISTAASNAYGSRLIPATWADTIATTMVAQSGVLQAGPTIIRTSGGGAMHFPTLSTDIAAAAITEGSAATQDTPVFGTVDLASYDEGGYFIITEDLIADSGPDVDTYLAGLAGRAIAQRVAAYLGDADIGSGSTAPHAITVHATSGVTAGSAAGVTTDEMIALYGSVIPPYRVNGKWIVNNEVFVDTLQAKSAGGYYLFAPSISASAPDTFLGKPFIEDQYFDAIASGRKPMGFGDVAAAYIVRYVGPIQIDFSAEAGFTSFEVYCRYKIRFDAATLLADAFKVVTLG